MCVWVSECGLVKIARRVDCPALPQTVDLTARLPAAESSNLGSATIRVLVVDPEGLVTIYSPMSPSESVSSAVTIGSDIRSKVISKVMAGHRRKINTEVTPTTTKSPTAVSRQYEAPWLSTYNLSISVWIDIFVLKLGCLRNISRLFTSPWYHLNQRIDFGEIYSQSCTLYSAQWSIPTWQSCELLGLVRHSYHLPFSRE
jgi:hypothetical protein